MLDENKNYYLKKNYKISTVLYQIQIGPNTFRYITYLIDQACILFKLI